MLSPANDKTTPPAHINRLIQMDFGLLPAGDNRVSADREAVQRGLRELQ